MQERTEKEAVYIGKHRLVNENSRRLCTQWHTESSIDGVQQYRDTKCTLLKTEKGTEIETDK